MRDRAMIGGANPACRYPSLVQVFPDNETVN